MKKITKLSIFFIFFFLPFVINAVYADMGPKPESYFKVTLDGNEVPSESEARMLTCGKTYDDNKPYEYQLSKFNPNITNRTDDLDDILFVDIENYCYWRTDLMAWARPKTCEDSTCGFTYWLPDNFKLFIKLPDGRFFVSDEIVRSNIYSYYKADFYSDGTSDVKEVTSWFSQDRKLYIFGASFLITLLIEFLVALIILNKKSLSKKFFVTFLVANALSFTWLWLTVWSFTKTYTSFSYMASIHIIRKESLIVVFEYLVFWLLFKNTLSKKRIILFVFIANLLSYLAGYALNMFNVAVF